MKKLLSIAAVFAACGLSSVAHAQNEPADSAPVDGAAPASAVVIDAFYIANSSLDIVPDLDTGLSKSKDDGNGGGGRISVGLVKGLRLNGEYQTASLDEADVDQLRAGVSWLSTGNIRLGVGAEYIQLKLKTGGDSIKPDGYGLHAIGQIDFSEWLQGYGQLGYVDVKDDESAAGFEYLFGLVVMPVRNVGLFIDYRGTRLDSDDEEVQFKLNDFRAGVRVAF